MFCIKCGKESKLYSNLCKDCFAEKNKFSSIPKYCNITICPTCNARLQSKHWVTSQNHLDAVKEGVSEYVKVDPQIKTSNIDIDLKFESKYIAAADIICKIKYDDLALIEHLESEVRVKYEQCGVCSKIAANYYTAIIQLRADNRPLTENEVDNCLNRIEENIDKVQELDKSIFISKIEQKHGGYDIYLSHQSTAKSIVKNLVSTYGGTMNSSSSLVGQKDGQEIYKMTYLLRLPQYQLGDIVEIDGDIVFVFKLSSQKLDLIELSTWRRFTVSPKRIKKIKILGNKKECRKGQIVSQTDNEFQILDLDNYKTYDVLKPNNFSDYENEFVKAVDKNEIYLLMNDDNIFIIPPLN